MHPKWRAPACYVGVAVLCAVYLMVVPGVRFTDVFAGAGLGAAVMWAINEWETGKWNVTLTVQPALAGFAQPIGQPALAGDAAAFQAMAPAPPASVATTVVVAAPAAAVPAAAVAETVAPPPPALPEPAEPRQRVDSGTATPDKMEKWELDEKEPSWDPTALAETWAKLRAELSINRSQRPAVAPDLPRTAQLARTSAPAKNPAPARTAPGKAAAPAFGRTPGDPKPAAAVAQPIGYTLGNLGKSGGSPVLSRLATNAPSPQPARKVAAAGGEPNRQPPSFLRPGTFRPR